jgi:hypothetical protein
MRMSAIRHALPLRALVVAAALTVAWDCHAAALAKKDKADRHSANILPLIREIQSSGIKSLRGSARALAARGVRTARGGEFLCRLN